MMSRNPKQIYVRDLMTFKDETINRLKQIIQLVANDKAVYRKLEAIKQELDALAIQAGKTQDDNLIEAQTMIEEILKPGIQEIIKRYETRDKKYFDAVAQTIRELKKFAMLQSVGADIYIGCEVISRKKIIP